jgi:PXPV repeat-containing protein
MKILGAVVLIAALMLAPGVASAGSSTDAALGLGAFAVFNQILGGVGVFARPAPVVVASPPVVYTPAPPVIYTPPPVAYLPPPPVYVAPQPVYVAPRPVVVYRPAPVYRRVATWCPPGQAKHGRCGDGWYPHR